MQGNVNIPDSTITTNLSFRQLVLMNMQQLTNFPYIEKDFDALTDYELLCLVVKFLNDVIANQNEQNNSITRMYQSFLALQDYVNNTKDELEDAFNNLDDYVRNYFDNLDVQDEINNKLDEMLEDGVLEQIIEQFINSTALWVYDTVADMKQATNLINGSYAKTLGYYSVNDGGSSIYKITDTESLTDYQEELNSGLYATLIIEENITPEQFGAYGDGIHDDTNALITSFNLSNKVIYLKGTYLYSDDLILNSSLFSNTGVLKAIIENKKIYINDNSNIKIEGINFDGNYLKGQVIEINNSSNIEVNLCNFYNKGNDTDAFSNGFIRITNNSYNIEITNSKFNYCHSAQDASGIWVETGSNHINITNCEIEDISPILDADGVKILGTHDAYAYVSNCKFVDCHKRALKFQAKECHSFNNTMIFNVPCLFTIEFQKGHGSSINDTFIYNYTDYELGNDGVVYNAISIATGYVTVDNLNIKLNGTIEDFTPITISRIFDIHAQANETNQTVENISISNVTCPDKFTNNFLYVVASNIAQLQNVSIKNCLYNNNLALNTFQFNSVSCNNLDISINTVSNYGYRLIANENNISNSKFETNYRLISYSSNFMANNNVMISHSNDYVTSNLRRENNQTIVKLKDNVNPNEKGTSQYSPLFNCPAGTIALCNTPALNSDTNKYKIGYICTVAGTNSASGTFVPIEI